MFNKPVKPFWAVKCSMRDRLFISKCSFNRAIMGAYVTDFFGRRFIVPYVEPNDRNKKLSRKGLCIRKARKVF